MQLKAFPRLLLVMSIPCFRSQKFTARTQLAAADQDEIFEESRNGGGPRFLLAE
jgi:hypothetical protein